MAAKNRIPSKKCIVRKSRRHCFGKKKIFCENCRIQWAAREDVVVGFKREIVFSGSSGKSVRR